MFYFGDSKHAEKSPKIILKGIWWNVLLYKYKKHLFELEYTGINSVWCTATITTKGEIIDSKRHK